MMALTREDREKHFSELSAATPEGVARRARLQIAIEGTSQEFHALGTEMNQCYDSSAVYLADEGPRPPVPAYPILQHEISTYPGSRLPHAWLNTRVPGRKFSTIDLAGHGSFCILTGIGGKEWKNAAKKVAAELGVEIRAYAIGWRQDFEDVYFDWARRRGVEEAGCVLVRPDRFVVWRSHAMLVGQGERGCEEKLGLVMRSLLGRKGGADVNMS